MVTHDGITGRTLHRVVQLVEGRAALRASRPMAWIDTTPPGCAWSLAPTWTPVRAGQRPSRAWCICVIPAGRAPTGTRCALAHRQCDSYALGIHPLYVAARRDETWPCWPNPAAARRSAPGGRWAKSGLDLLCRGWTPNASSALPRAAGAVRAAFDHPDMCARSADQLLKCRQLSAQHRHAFNGSLQQARRLLRWAKARVWRGAVTTAPCFLRRAAARQPGDGNRFARHSPHWLYTTAAEAGAGPAQGRNTPAELPRIAQVVADLRGMAVADLAQASTANACATLPGLQKLLHQNGL